MHSVQLPDLFAEELKLRNVANTAPYSHNGSIATLDEAVCFYNRGGVEEDRYGRSPDVHPLGLSEEEIADLVAFLGALSSPLEYCVSLERPPGPVPASPGP